MQADKFTQEKCQSATLNKKLITERHTTNYFVTFDIECLASPTHEVRNKSEVLSKQSLLL